MYTGRSLLRAAATNNLQLLEESLNRDLGPVSGSDVDEALVKAATLGHVTCAEKLLAAGADPDNTEHDADGDTPLILASINNHYKMVKLLLATATCSLEGRGENDRTALHAATWNNRTTIVRMLLRAGSDTGATDCDRETAVMLACRRGLQDTLRLLLLKEDTLCKYSVQNQNWEGTTAVHYAARYGHDECLKMVLNQYLREDVLKTIGCSRSDVLDAQDVMGRSAVMLAGVMGHAACVELLVNVGCSLEVKSDLGRTALHCAVRAAANKENVERARNSLMMRSVPVDNDVRLRFIKRQVFPIRCVELLIRAGADVNVRDRDNRTPLWEVLDFKPLLSSAQQQQQHPIAAPQQLTDYASDEEDEEDDSKEESLSDVEEHRQELIDLLLAANADVNAPGTASLPGYCTRTVCVPLQYLLAIRDYHTMRRLIHCGADNRYLYGFYDPLAMGSAPTWVVEAITVPTRLLLLCKGKIRKCLGNGLSKCYHQLPLPEALKMLIAT